MSYNIKSSSGRLINIADGVIDRRFAVSLLGDEVNDFGPSVAQTLYQLLENFSSDVPPESNPYVNIDPSNNTSYETTPLTGQLWYDNVGKRLNVYDGEKWSSVTSNISGVSFDFTPSIDQELNIGSSDLRWHTIYGTHLVVNTNRRDGLVGYKHSDNNPAITVDGDLLIGSTSVVDSPAVGRILPSGNGLSMIGKSDNTFDAIYSEKYIVGNNVGFKHKSGKDSIIYPTSNTEDTGASVGVHMGDHSTPFDSMCMLDLKTAKLSALTNYGVGVISISTGVDLVPTTNNDSNLGSSAKLFGTINVSTVNTKSLQNADGGELVFVNDIKMADHDIVFSSKNTGLKFNSDRDQLVSYGDVSNSSYVMGYGVSYNSNGSHQFSSNNIPAMMVEMKNDATGPSLFMRVSSNETIVAGEQITWGGVVSVSKDDIRLTVGDNDVIINSTGTTIETLTINNINTSGTDGIVTNGDILMNFSDAILVSSGFKQQGVSILTPTPDIYSGDNYLNVISVNVDDKVAHGSSVYSAAVEVGHEDIGFINLRITEDAYYGGELEKIKVNGSPILYAMLNSVYPIGTVYENYSVETNPSSLLSWPASTWVMLGIGRMLIGSDYGTTAQDNVYGNNVPDTNGETFGNDGQGLMGGEYNHKLSPNEMPKHAHYTYMHAYNVQNGGGDVPYRYDTSAGNGTATSEAGSDVAHNNMPPYLTVYRWVRTA